MIKIYKNKYLLITLVIFIVAIIFISFSDVYAIVNGESISGGSPFSGGSPGGKLADPFESATIFQLIQKIIGYLIKIGASILAIMIIYGGFLILTAGDSPEKVKSGKDVILWAVVGYIIVLCSWGVIYIMGQIITGNQEAFIKPK
mgnify:CR=1 FL=1